jgi:hypothetical protein
MNVQQGFARILFGMWGHGSRIRSALTSPSRLLLLALTLVAGVAAGSPYHSGIGMAEAARKAAALNKIEHPDYVWSQPYCLRYRSPDPNLLILGDSIFDGWSGYLLHVFPRAVVDAKVGRQFSAGVREYARLRQYSGIRSIRTIVVELGTNGTVYPADVERFMRMVGFREVIFIVPEVPRPWEKEVQSVYEELPRYYPNVRLVSWNRLAQLPNGKENPRYFWGDGVHPNWRGIRVLVGALQRAIEAEPDRSLYWPGTSRNASRRRKRLCLVPKKHNPLKSLSESAKDVFWPGPSGEAADPWPFSVRPDREPGSSWSGWPHSTTGQETAYCSPP